MTGLVLTTDVAGSTPDPGSNVAMDSRGYLYTTTYDPGRIAVWRPDGSFDNAFGQRGDGPEEFRCAGPMLFVDGQDRVHATCGARQWVVLSPLLEWIASTERTEVAVDDDFSILLPNGTIVTWGVPETWFATAKSTGEFIARFGDLTSGGLDSPDPMDHVRTITPAGNDRFWAASEHNSTEGYTLELWGIDGTRHLTFKREVPWFPPGAGVPVDQTEIPPPRTSLITVDSTGLMLAVTQIANERYTEMRSAPSDRIAEIAAQVWELRIEAIDARAGVVLASETFLPPDAINLVERFLPGRLIGYRFVDSPEGLRQVHFFRAELTRN